MELVDKPMRLKYYMRSQDAVYDAGPAEFGKAWYDFFLQSMIRNDNTGEFIFFLVVESTDIFEREWNFNEVVTPNIFAVPYCIGTRACEAKKHANDCPKWEE